MRRSLSWYGAAVVEPMTISPESPKTRSDRYFLPPLWRRVAHQRAMERERVT